MTLAAVALLSTWLDGPVVGGILFFGMAVTFGLVSILPTPHGRMVWALIPAGIMVVLGAAMMLAIPSVFNYVWAVALILVGVYLLLRQTGRGEISPRS